MLTYPTIDPVAFAIGPINLHWYGVRYVIGFLVGGILGRWRVKKPSVSIEIQQIWDLVFFVALGVVLGGRLGYILFYNLSYYLAHPIEWLFIWSGGMSFHGGLLGVLIEIWIFARRNGKRFLEISDFIAPLCPIGFGAGRIGNFVNQELWGRVSDVPWAMIFPEAGGLARHPSQLYEAFLEGIVLFFIIWVYSMRPRKSGAISGLFLLAYGIIRFFVEFYREPDSHLGLIAFDWMSMGQVLSIPMILAGTTLLWWSGKKI